MRTGQNSVTGAKRAALRLPGDHPLPARTGAKTGRNPADGKYANVPEWV